MALSYRRHQGELSVETDGLRTFRYVPITRRPKIVWPGEAELAVWVIPNIEFFAEGRAVRPSVRRQGSVLSVRARAQRDYERVGIWRIMEVLTKNGICASPTVNSDMRISSEIIAEAAAWLGAVGYNKTISQRLNAIPPEQERELIHNALDRLQQASGKRPPAG